MNTNAERPIKKILAATDLSEHCRNALDVAANLAKAHRAKLQLIHAVETLPMASAWGDPGGVSWIGIESLISSGRKQLADEAKRLSDNFGISAEAHVFTGSAPGKISQFADENAIDLVVVGSRGHRRIIDRLLGTGAQNIVRVCKQPVLIVRRDARLAWHQIIAATDFSESANVAARMARALAPDVAMQLVHIDSPIPAATLALARPDAAQLALFNDKRNEHSAKLLQETAKLLGDKVTTVHLKGDPKNQLEKLLDDSGADLLALGTHGRSRIEAGLLGSFSQAAMNLGDCDVLVTRAQEPLK